MDFWEREFLRLVLVYGVPAAIWAAVFFFIAPLFPNETGQGGTVSETGLLVIVPIFLIAIAIGFYFHFKSRRW